MVVRPCLLAVLFCEQFNTVSFGNRKKQKNRTTGSLVRFSLQSGRLSQRGFGIEWRALFPVFSLLILSVALGEGIVAFG